MRFCSQCQTEKPLSDFNTKGKSGRLQTYCKACQYLYQMIRWNTMKIRAVEYLGGKCIGCGFEGHPVLFDFHHRNSLTKEVNWNLLRKRSWFKIKLELDKCDLVCCKCQRMLHIDPTHWKC